jgi:tRNA pseudouridine38-40 synthase
LRYFVKFAYNGKNYHGWQVQPDAISVQEVLNKALSTLLRQNIDVVGAGRTDAGVHATIMYAHFDYEQEIEVQTLVKRMNSFLPKDIVVYDFIQLHDDAHARFDAIARTYEYHIHTFKDAFINEGSWYQHQILDIELMNDAAKILFEYIDFECFSKTHTDVNTFNCVIKEAYWVQNGNHLIFTVTADRFLRNMVRAIVGTLINVGLGKLSLTGFREVIESKSRKKAGFSVPAHGLYLTKVIYPYLDNENN